MIFCSQWRGFLSTTLISILLAVSWHPSLAFADHEDEYCQVTKDLEDNRTEICQALDQAAAGNPVLALAASTACTIVGIGTVTARETVCTLATAIPKHRTGDVYHGIWRGGSYSGPDRHQGFTDHGEGWKYVAVWSCGQAPNCPGGWDGGPYCSDASDSKHNVRCDIYVDGWAYSDNNTWPDPGKSDCPAESQGYDFDYAWSEFYDGHGMCGHYHQETKGSRGLIGVG